MDHSLRTLVFFFEILFLLMFISGKQHRRGGDLKITQKFQNQGDVSMTRDEIGKVSADALASSSGKKLNELRDDQLGGVGDSLKKSKKLNDLLSVMNKLSRANAFKLVKTMKKSKKKLPKGFSRTIWKALKQKTNGDISNISPSELRALGPQVLKDLKVDDIKKMSKNRETFRAYAEEISKVKNLPNAKRKAVLDVVIEQNGKPGNWNETTCATFCAFLRADEIKEVNTKTLKGAVDELTKNAKTMKVGIARKIISRLVGQDGFGNPKNWDSSTLKKIGGLAKGLRLSSINEMNTDALKSSMKELEEAFSKSQARTVMNKITKSNPTKQWKTKDLNETGKLVKGLNAKDLKDLQIDVVRNLLVELKAVSTELKQDQKREIAKKIDKPSKWTKDDMEQVGNLCYGKSSEDLKQMDARNAVELVGVMKPEKLTPEAKNRVLKEKIFENGNVNLTEAGAVADVMTLNDLKNADPSRELGIGQPDIEIKRSPWKLDQARQLIERSKAQEGELDGKVEDLIDSGLAKGFTKDDLFDITNLPIEELADEIYHPREREALLERFKKDKDIKTASDFSKLTQEDIASLGSLVEDLKKEERDNLSQDVAVEAYKKMGENTKLTEKPFQLVKNLLESALKVMERESGEELAENDLLNLGELVCGLSAERIAKITTKVFNVTRYTFSEKKCFNSEQLKALAKKAKESFNLQSLTSEDLLDLGVIISVLEPKDIKAIPHVAIQEAMFDLFEDLDLSNELAGAVMESAAKKSSRRRRTIDVSTTGKELIARGNLLLGLTPADIATVNDEAFDEAASTIGSIDGFSQEQLEAWAAKAKQAWNSDPALINEDQLLKLGAIAIGFSDSDLGKMDLSNDDIIENLGSQKVRSAGVTGYSRSQLEKAWSQIKTLKAKRIAAFSGSEISNIKNFALALTTEEIGSIPKETFPNCIGSLGKINGWSDEQMIKLKEKAIEAYGPVKGWSAAKLRESGSTIGGFSKAEIQSLSGEQIGMVKPEAMKNIPPSLYAAFTEAQFKEFDYNQAAAVTDEQMQALPDEMKKILDEKKGLLELPNSGATQTYPSQVFIAILIGSKIMIHL